MDIKKERQAVARKHGGQSWQNERHCYVDCQSFC